MKKYNCNRPDQYSILSSKELPVRDGALKWHIVNFSDDMTKKDQVMTFKDVFDIYAYELFPIRLMSTENREEAYFKIAFVDKNNQFKIEGELRECPHQFDEGTLAVAYGNSGYKWDGWTFVNDSYYWGMKSNGGKHILKVALVHELGHAFGIGHTDVVGDIMYPTYAPNNKFTDDSRTALNSIHGFIKMRLIDVSPASRWIKNNIELRTVIREEDKSEKRNCLTNFLNKLLK